MFHHICTRRFVLLAALFVFPVVTHANFSDVSSDDPYADAIAYVEAQGIVSGYADGTYRASSTINRAEFTKILVGSAFGAEVRGSGKPVFQDVNGSEWFAPYIEKAVQEHIVSGYGVTDAMLLTFTEEDRLRTAFFPSHQINFAEAAKILVNALDIEMKPTDVQGNWWDEPYGQGPSGTWWQTYVNALLREEALPANWLPDAPVTRGEMAEMIYRLKKHSVAYEEGSVTENDSWKTYINNVLHYSIQHPSDWMSIEGSSGVGFLPQSAQGGDAVWGVSAYARTSENANLKSLPIRMGLQFEDRLESRETLQVDGQNALLVTVTTNQSPDFISEVVYIETSDVIYVIQNGARNDPQFVKFYTSFRLISK